MSVTLTKKIFTSANSYIASATDDELVSDTLLKVVFTSTNMPDDSAAGTRSYTQPGSKYLGTWYETYDIIHKTSEDQDYMEYPYTSSECMYRTLTLLSGTLNLTSGATGVFWHNYANVATKEVSTDEWNFKVGLLGDTTKSGTSGWTAYSNAFFHYNDSVYGYIDSYSLGTATISGVAVNTVTITFGDVTGSAVLSGTLDTPSDSTVDYATERTWPGGKIYNKTEDYGDRLIETEDWYLTPMNSVIYEVSFGEAYDCRLTAWDDDTHSTIENQILADKHYKVDAVAYRYDMVTETWDSDSTEYYHYTFPSPGCFVEAPVRNQVLQGDNHYYGDFDLIYSTTLLGECLIFKPRLADMDDSFSAGSYDFVTTLHYQYT